MIGRALPHVRRLAARRSARAAGARVIEETRLRGAVRRTELALARAGRTGRPVIAGPFVGELGFELLYWIPALRRLISRYGIERDQVTAISRGGADFLYADLAGSYLDAYDVLSEQQLRRRLTARRAEAGDSKQLAVLALDRDLLEAARGRLGLADALIIHPSVMYVRLRYLWAGERPDAFARRHLAPARLELPRLPELPERYVAVKAYESSCLPGTAGNTRLVSDVVDRVSSSVAVVALSDASAFDGHDDFAIEPSPAIHDLASRLVPRNNLELKARAVAGARTLLCTYGGFSYLAPLLGVPSVTLRSNADVNPVHERIMGLACSDLGLPRPRPFDATAGATAEEVARSAVPPRVGATET